MPVPSFAVATCSLYELMPLPGSVTVTQVNVAVASSYVPASPGAAGAGGALASMVIPSESSEYGPWLPAPLMAATLTTYESASTVLGKSNVTTGPTGPTLSR